MHLLPYTPCHVEKFQCTFQLELSFPRTLEGDFVSGIGLLAHDAKSTGQRSILTFRFQARGSVFLQSTKINDDSNVLPCSKKVLSDFDSSYRSFLCHPII